MIRLDKLYEPIQDKNLPSLRPLLQSLQGNILRGHGRDRSVHLFLHFKTGKAGEVCSVLEKQIVRRTNR